LKFAAFKLKNDPQRVRVGQVSDDLSQIEEFSIDAEGRLMTNDCLDYKKVEAYLRNAIK
jgi:hypothetical protein